MLSQISLSIKLVHVANVSPIFAFHQNSLKSFLHFLRRQTSVSILDTKYVKNFTRKPFSFFHVYVFMFSCKHTLKFVMMHFSFLSLFVRFYEKSLFTNTIQYILPNFFYPVSKNFIQHAKILSYKRYF